MADIHSGGKKAKEERAGQDTRKKKQEMTYKQKYTGQTTCPGLLQFIVFKMTYVGHRFY